MNQRHVPNAADRAGPETLFIALGGRFHVCDAEGEELTPKPLKCQALLALLASGEERLRSRAWLRARLWSDRSPQQGAASLRQSLSVIRKALGPHCELLQADRQNVWLDADNVKVTCDLPDGPQGFLDGLDIKDAAFNGWLAAERARLSKSDQTDTEPQAPRLETEPRPPSIRFHSVSSTDPMLDWSQSAFLDAAAMLIRETYCVDIVTVSSVVDHNSDYTVTMQGAVDKGSGIAIRLTLTEAATGRQLWGISRAIPARGVPLVEHPVTRQAMHMLLDAVGQALYEGQRRTARQTGLEATVETALRKMFTMQKGAVQEADDLLRIANRADPSAIYLAWQTQVRTIQYAEKHKPDRKALAEDARALFERALEMDPNNSVVLSTAANAVMHLEKDFETGHALAERAIALNPSNAFAWCSLSAAQLYIGDTEKSLLSAQHGRQIAMYSPRSFWWDLHLGAVAIVMGNHEDALRYFLSASAQRPDFRPPLRYLIALNASRGDVAAARQLSGRLSKLERGFTPDQLFNDPDYPASLIHRSPGLSFQHATDLT